MKASYLTNNSFPASLSFVDNINLSAADYTITTGGTYNMTCGSDGYYLYFSDPASLPGARVVITNTGYGDNWNGDISGSYIPKQGATDTDITAIAVGRTYNFVSDGQHWRNLPLTGIAASETAGALTDNYYITKAGVYSTSTESVGTIHVYLPDPILLDGQTLKFFNPNASYNLNLYEHPIYALNYSAITPPYSIGSSSFLEIISVGGKWRFIQLQSI